MRSSTRTIFMASAALFVSLPMALAQDAAKSASDTAPAADSSTTPTAGNAPSDGKVVALPDWHPEIDAETSMSVEAVLGYDVYGLTGEEIGDVENVLLGLDGEVLSVIAEVGGIWDIGDTHVNVPWADVDVDPAVGRIVLPVSQETVEDYTLFTDDVVAAPAAVTDIQEVSGDGPGLLETGPRVWQARELINDYVRLKDGETFVNYGYVDDLVIQDGKVSAVIVRPDVAWGARGLYAYPYYGYSYGWTPGAATYDLPYDRADVEGLEPLNEGIWED